LIDTEEKILWENFDTLRTKKNWTKQSSVTFRYSHSVSASTPNTSPDYL